jgi:hypothetical protein
MPSLREVLAASPRASHGAGGRTDLPGISYARFHAEYAAAFRRKHLLVVPDGRFSRLRLAARLLFGRTGATRRLYPLPSRSPLPRELIRLDPWEGEYLFLVAQLATRGIVEIGRFRGGSTFLLSCANREVPIWSIDTAPSDDEGLRQLFAENGTGENVELLVGDSHADAFPEIGDFDLLFIDGDHTREGCRADLESFVPDLATGGHLVVHDCYAEFQVQQAVLDYVDPSELTAVVGPYTTGSHWHAPTGSIGHFVKAH